MMESYNILKKVSLFVRGANPALTASWWRATRANSGSELHFSEDEFNMLSLTRRSFPKFVNVIQSEHDTVPANQILG